MDYHLFTQELLNVLFREKMKHDNQALMLLTSFYSESILG